MQPASGGKRVAEVVLFGEAMLRLSPPRFERLEQASTFRIVVGGSELSVAANLSRLGVGTTWVSALPATPIGRMVANAARQQGVDTSAVRWTEEGRVGVIEAGHARQLGAARRMTDHLHVATTFQQRAKAAAHQRVRGGYHDAEGGLIWHG